MDMSFCLYFNNNKFENTNELFFCQQIFIKLNIDNVSVLSTKLYWRSRRVFHRLIHNYPTNFSELNYTKPKLKQSQSKFQISFRCPRLWKGFLNKTGKQIDSHSVFRTKLKNKLKSTSNEVH